MEMLARKMCSDSQRDLDRIVKETWRGRGRGRGRGWRKRDEGRWKGSVEEPGASVRLKNNRM